VPARTVASCGDVTACSRGARCHASSAAPAITAATKAGASQRRRRAGSARSIAAPLEQGRGGGHHDGHCGRAHTRRPRGLSASGHTPASRAREAATLASVPEASILLLDDDPDVGLAAQLLLQRRVAPVTCLRRPAELAAALAALRPALLLLDLNFGPGRTDGAQGLRLLADVQARAQPPVVVVMTAYADIDLAVQALGAARSTSSPSPGTTCAWSPPAARPCSARSRRARARRAGAAAEPVRSLAAQERAAVLAAMAQAEGNLSAAARLLGLSRAALYRRLDKHGL
jgi:two-component system response regulator RegA